jgi:hypothetical protein
VNVDQTAIKVILIAVFAVLAIIVVVPGRGARRMAIRRLIVLAVVVIGIVAIAFPSVTNEFAQVLGVGRGADLLLYGLIVVFLGFVVTSAAHTRRTDRQITDLARALALAQAASPAGSSASDESDGSCR